jgi:hypothetical protein
MPQFQLDQGLGSAMWRSLSDWIAGEELQPKVDVAEVQGRYNQQRDGVRGRAAGVGFEGAFRPREVLDADEFERHDVATLRQKVDHIDLKAVNDLVAAWNTIADRHQTSLETFKTAMERATDDSVWRGEARNAAASAVSDYAAQGAQVSNAARLTGNKLSELLTGLEPTKQLVPHAPEHRSGWDNLRGFVVGRDWRNDDVAERNAKTEALRVLRTVYSPVVMESDTNVPVIPRPVSTANPNGNGDGSNPRSTNNGSGNPSGTSSPSSNPSDSNSDTTSETPESTSTDPASTTEDSTTPASTTPATTPASTTPAPTTSPNTPGTPHTSTPGSPGSPSSPGGPGVSVPSKGAPSNPSVVPAAARTGASPGRAGTSGMSGMSPGARGGKSDEESTKGIPHYLITQEHGNELMGLDELPRTVPPVIGDNSR